jgi:hypothetical protein
MAEFEYSQDPDPQWNDRCFLAVDNRYTMSIVRTHNGIEIDVWPINEGKVWDMPFSMIQILDSDTAIDPHPSHHEQPPE